jgi:hypothetical protein
MFMRAVDAGVPAGSGPPATPSYDSAYELRQEVVARNSAMS